MPELSVVIITLNEERNIGRCIDSVREFADEIIVVDSLSTDRTEQICLEKGARFIKNKFPGYIEQKNFAISQASYPFILSLDADETVSEELKQSIMAAKAAPAFDGYTMNRLTSYCDKWIRHCGWYPDRKLRLWNSTMGKWGGMNPHDKYEMVPGARIGHLKGDLLHYSYYSINDHIIQVNKFSGIGAQAYFDRGKRAPMLKIIFNPVITFIKDYFIRLGFLDGYYGFVICVMSAHSKFLKYVKLRELYKQKKSY